MPNSQAQSDILKKCLPLPICDLQLEEKISNKTSIIPQSADKSNLYVVLGVLGSLLGISVIVNVIAIQFILKLQRSCKSQRGHTKTALKATAYEDQMMISI